jgi:hypothetical protein
MQLLTSQVFVKINKMLTAQCTLPCLLTVDFTIGNKRAITECRFIVADVYIIAKRCSCLIDIKSVRSISHDFFLSKQQFAKNH